MSLQTVKLNNDRFSGNRLFMHKFKNFSTNSTKTSFKIQIIHALIFIGIILSIVYILFVIFIIGNIINKKESLAMINNLNIKSAKIEKEYKLAITPITKNFALANGYVEIDMNNFAARKDNAASLSFLYEAKSKN